MPWYGFAFLVAVLVSASSLIEKRALRIVHSLDYSVALSLVGLVLALPFVFLFDFSDVDKIEVTLIAGASLFAAMAFYLVARGMRHLEISTVAPLLALSPGASSVLAFFMLNEGLDSKHIFGIIFMIVGSYILTIDPNKKLYEPFSFFKKSRYAQFVLLSLVFYSFGAVFDRAIVSVFDVPIPAYIFLFHIFVSASFLLISFSLGGTLRGITNTFKTAGPDVFLSGLMTVGYRYFQLEALTLASVGLVSAIKRSSTFITVFVGGELFHEKNLVRKMIASAVIIGGAFLIVL